MIDECIYMVATCLNSFPNKNGISQTISPSAIILGRGPIDGNCLRGVFGRYYEVFCGTDNTQKQRRVSAICLRPSNNQGGYYFMSLDTGAKIHGFNFKELAITNTIIDRVHELAEMENAPDLDEDGCPIFEWEIGDPVHPTNNPIADELDDTPQDIDDNSDDESDTSDHEYNDENNTDEEHYNDDESMNNNNNTEIMEHESMELISDDVETEEIRSATNTEARSVATSDVEVRSEESVKEEHSEYSDNENSIEEARSEIANENIVTGKRIRKQTELPNIGSFDGKKYHANMLQIGQDRFSKFEQVKYGFYTTAVGICFNQMTATKGIKLHGEKAIAAMFKEYNQLQDMKVLGRINPDALSQEQKRKALRAINLIKEK